MLQRKDLKEKLTECTSDFFSPLYRLAEFLELSRTVYFQYKMALPEEKRDVTSNRLVEGKSVDVVLNFPFLEIANRFQNTNGAPHRDIPRTWDAILPKLLAHFTDQDRQANKLDMPSEYNEVA